MKDWTKSELVLRKCLDLKNLFFLMGIYLVKFLFLWKSIYNQHFCTTYSRKYFQAESGN